MNQYAIVSRWVENVKMYAIYPVVNNVVDTEKPLAFITHEKHARNFVIHVLHGRIY
jgi:hypothetical protein